MGISGFVNTRLAEVALQDIDGFPFERFCNDFMPGLMGVSYVPLGGAHDGGADGLEERIHEQSDGSNVYFQATVQPDARAKARRTVKRLREFGRSPSRVTLVSAVRVAHVDKLEQEISKELSCNVAIRDRAYICAHLNDSDQTRTAFWQHLWPLTAHLREVSMPAIEPPSTYASRPIVHTFLAQQAARSIGERDAADSMVDALILWSLEGTDPDRKILRDLDEITERVRAKVPAVESLFSQRARDRLRAMCAKSYPGGRAVNWHRSEDAYCLPHATRQRLEEERVEDIAWRQELEESIGVRVADNGLTPAQHTLAVQVVIATLQRVYERESVEFAAFLDRSDPSASHETLADHLRATLEDVVARKEARLRIGPVALNALRGILYSSTATERKYLQRVSNTYALLFSLASHPELAGYFRAVAKTFYLYVGSDVILRAMSEHNLRAEDQLTKNALEVVARCGATLVLTETVVEETIGHLRASDLEHKNHFVTDDVPYEIARNAPHIMLRSYLYSHNSGEVGAPVSWRGFVQRYLDYDDLHRKAGADDLRRYLVRAFSMEYVSRDDLLALTDPAEVAELAGRLGRSKRNQRLADNDALMPLAVYGRRRAQRESGLAGEFGLQTWWLTWERSISKHTRQLEEKEGARYSMRPEFLLKFISLSPERARVQETYADSFTSALGLSLGRRVSPDAFHGIMRQVNESQGLDVARRSAAIAKLVDRIKSGQAADLARAESPLDQAAARESQPIEEP